MVSSLYYYLDVPHTLLNYIQRALAFSPVLSKRGVERKITAQM